MCVETNKNIKNNITVTLIKKLNKLIMKIIILGAGAIGSLYAAKLSKLNDVTVITRQQHANKINKFGLRIIGVENKIYKLKASTRIQEIGKDTVILLTTKVYDNKKSINDIKNLIKRDAIILCLQNGLYGKDIVKKIIGNRCMVLRGVTNFGAIFLKPGVVQFKNYSYTAIEKSKKSQEIAENFAKCGLNGYVSDNIKFDVWKKLIFNCVLNPITSILGIENRGIVNKDLNPLKKAIAEECLRVAEKVGIKFDVDFIKTINKEFKNSRNISSMQQDLIKGKKTEIDYLNGAVVELGKKHGIKCPVNESLISMIKFLENQKK